MAISLRAPSALLLLTAATASGQQPGTAPIVQPGPPGQAGKVLSAAAVKAPVWAPAAADTEFMQGMIVHHSQAVDMVALLKTHSHNKALLAFGDRITISQSDEMKYMQKWLADRGKPLVGSMDHMAGMDHSKMNMDDMPVMPGMLSPNQMKALAKANGPAFDHLFLTGMIHHHTGALMMVEDLFDTPGAGQDPVLFDFATDVDNTQRAEIKIMQSMLDKEKK